MRKASKNRKEEEPFMLRRQTLAPLQRGAGNALIGLAVAGALVCGGTAAGAQPAVKLAIVTYLSGPGAGPFGIPLKNAANIVVAAINNGTLPAPYHSRGFAGAKVDPVIIDEAGSPTQVVENYRNLVQQRHVDAVVGYINSGNCLALAPVAEELKSLTVYTSCGTSRVFEGHSYHYVFRTAPMETIDGVGAALYLKKEYPHATVYAGINQNYAWGQDSWHQFTASMNAIEPHSKVTVALWPKLFSGQYSAEISTLLIHKQDIIHSSLWGGDLAAFVEQASARRLGQHSRLLLPVGEILVFTLSKRIPNGTIIGADGAWGVFAHNSPLNNWFRETYEKHFGTPPIFASYQAADALVALKAAYEKAERQAGQFPTPAEVIKALTHLKFEGVGETFDMALGQGHQAVTEMAYGTYEYDAKAQKPKITKVVYFPAWCVNPPHGVNAVEWIQGGLQGAKCDPRRAGR
jgi:branched-chain amino acid transport system substrate-binding protein